MGSRRPSAQRIGPVDVIAFALTDGAVALEHVASALEADERAPRGAAERVRQHLVAVPKDETADRVGPPSEGDAPSSIVQPSIA